MEIDLPLCVSECPNPELRDMAISAFVRGTDDDRNYYMTQCLTLQMATNEKCDKEKRLAKYKEWLSYVQVNVVIDNTQNGDPAGPADLTTDLGSFLDNEVLDTA